MRGKLTIDRQHEIDDTISNILDYVDMTYPENGLKDIITAYDNIGLYDFDFQENRHKINGAISYEDGQARIFINEDLSPARKTFTLAHEFGHFVLHPNQDKFRLDFFTYNDSKGSIEETEANYFAASLLMPKELFRRIYRLLDNESLVAKYFGVSTIAVRNRVRWMKQN